MKSFQSLLPAFSVVAAAQAWGNDWNETFYTTTTLTTDVYTTYCPEATTFTQGTKTYTATASETITITDCPCTVVTSHPTWGTSKPTTTVVPPPVWTTTTVTTDIYTTYCPAPTTVVQGSKTYTVAEATTLTITDCPCTYTTSTTCPPTSTPTWVAPPPPVKNATTTPPVWVTTTVSEYTTYCPTPTVISHGNKTWSVTSATTLTISECPCTLSYTTTPTWKTVSYFTTYCPQPTTVVISNNTYSLSSGTQTVPIVTSTPVGPITIGTTSPTKTPVGPSTAISSGSLQVTNAAKRFEAGAGAMAAAGLAALLL